MNLVNIISKISIRVLFIILIVNCSNLADSLCFAQTTENEVSADIFTSLKVNLELPLKPIAAGTIDQSGERVFVITAPQWFLDGLTGLPIDSAAITIDGWLSGQRLVAQKIKLSEQEDPLIFRDLEGKPAWHFSYYNESSSGRPGSGSSRHELLQRLDRYREIQQPGSQRNNNYRSSHSSQIKAAPILIATEPEKLQEIYQDVFGLDSIILTVSENHFQGFNRRIEKQGPGFRSRPRFVILPLENVQANVPVYNGALQIIVRSELQQVTISKMLKTGFIKLNEYNGGEVYRDPENNLIFISVPQNPKPQNPK